MTTVFADLETTGVDAFRHHLWEIGLIVRDDTGADREYCWQVRPDLTSADPMALKIGGYYKRAKVKDDQVGCARTLVDPDYAFDPSTTVRSVRTIAAELAAILDGVVLAAANVAFDAGFLAAFLRANGQAPAWDYHLLEVESYAAGAIGMVPPWKLDRLAAELGVKLPDGRHSALADARLARDVYDAARHHADHPNRATAVPR